LKVGDGTTSVVLLAGEFLKLCKPFVEEGVHPQIIVKAFRRATTLVKTLYYVFSCGRIVVI
jgi:T-complex protein 1 subunit eta